MCTVYNCTNCYCKFWRPNLATKFCFFICGGQTSISGCPGPLLMLSLDLHQLNCVQTHIERMDYTHTCAVSVSVISESNAFFFFAADSVIRSICRLNSCKRKQIIFHSNHIFRLWYKQSLIIYKSISQGFLLVIINFSWMFFITMTNLMFFALCI